MSFLTHRYSHARAGYAAGVGLQPRAPRTAQVDWTVPIRFEKREDNRDSDDENLAKAEERKFGYEGSYRGRGMAAIVVSVSVMLAVIYFAIRAFL